MSVPSNREETIFERALGIDVPEARDAFLREACGEDSALLARLQGLLTAHDRAGRFLEHKVPEPGAPFPAAGNRPSDEVDSPLSAQDPPPHAGGYETRAVHAPSEKSGDRIGRYKLLEPIGEGGFGAVWMAEQEEPVRRRVALKIIKLGMDTRSVIARFEAERQALALMDHPSIARVFDGGAAKSGRPFFVMELVRGLPITKYCDEVKMSTRERLELFGQVCRAVQHAHQKGIIHRDLKPSNILVTEQDGRPVPKVIDFGVAKAIEGRLTDKTLFTGFQQMIGTPTYMSPEQAGLGSLDIDTRSDIYSLGVLLYELLTGSTPFDTQEMLKKGYESVLRTIREVDPPKPSTRLTELVAADVRRLTSKSEGRDLKSEMDRASLHQLLQEKKELIHLLRGDLDWIVMKCLEKDRTRRYETANGVATDIQHHLNCETVVARPPSRLYEFQKTVRRHKFGFAAAAALIAVLALGVLVSIWQAVRATRAERAQIRLRKDAQSMEKKSDQVARMLQRMFEGIGPSRARGRDTQMLREILDETVRRLNEDLKDQPEVEAQLRLIIGKSYQDLALYPKAEAMVREALRLREVRFGRKHPDVAAALNILGAVLYEKGDLAGAKEVGLKAVRLAEELRMPDSVELASALNNLGNVLQTLNDLDGAEPIHRRALAMRRKLLGDDDGDVAGSYNSLANVLLQRGNFAAAEQSYASALEILKKQPGAITNTAVATVTHNVAILASSRGDLTGAEAMQHQVLAIRRAILSADHRDLAVTLNELAMVLAAHGTPDKIAQAEEMVTEAAKKKLLPGDHWRATTTINTLAIVLSKKGDLTAAEAKYREALEKRRELVGDENLLTVESLNRLAVLLAVRGDLAGAETNLTNALRVRRKVQGDNNPELIMTLLPLAWVNQQQGDTRQFESLKSEAVSLSLRRGDFGVWAFLDATFDLSDPLQVLRKFAEAEKLLLPAFEYLEKEQITNAAFWRGVLGRLVRLYEAWGKPDEAARWREKLSLPARRSEKVQP